MQQLVSLSDVPPAIAGLIRDHGGELPDVTYGVLAAFWPSVVDRIVMTCEALYAAADAIPSAGVLLAAQLAEMAQANAWYELGQTDRAARVVAACRRRLGELTEDQAPPADDPPPLSEFLPAPDGDALL